ncbi:chorismate mutase [Fluviicola sp.]|uniref:chorismate mutase n=1 Tax=Fluviicola sp. TaxID=1917219 RepID=UPI003D2A417A
MNENICLLELENLRTELQKLDAEFIRLLSERQRIACEIGAIKQRSGIPFEQPEIWNKHCLERRKLAVASGVHPDLVSQVFECIHRFSIDIQQHTTTDE